MQFFGGGLCGVVSSNRKPHLTGGSNLPILRKTNIVDLRVGSNALRDTEIKIDIKLKLFGKRSQRLNY